MFKVGDFVQCIDDDNGGYPAAKKGKIYEVLEVLESATCNADDFVTHRMEGSSGIAGSFAWRFIPVIVASNTNKTPLTPSHYQSPITPITYIRANNLNFNRGNIVKYATRAGKKDSEDAIDDLKKIIRYAEAEIKALEIEASKDKDWSKGI